MKVAMKCWMAAAALLAGTAIARAEDIVLAAGFVLSGPIAAYGEDGKVGLDLAAAEINASTRPAGGSTSNNPLPARAFFRSSIGVLIRSMAVAATPARRTAC